MIQPRKALTLTALAGLPLVKPGDDLARLLLKSLGTSNVTLEDADILVLGQKIVSKAEGRLVNLADIKPGPRASELARVTLKDARLVELMLSESRAVLRARAGIIIVQHRLGFVCANAGIDHSNVAGEANGAEESVLLLPVDPDGSASSIRGSLESASGKRLAVMIIDSHGRAWRLGTVGVCIGLSGMPALIDERGWTDLFGYRLRATIVGVADELAAAASLMMGQAAEGTPAVHVRGFPYPLQSGSLNELLRPDDQDLFR